ncbi:hypothetical protein RIR_jg12117.t1 [Rhizophagus irregularis DAOM 181602=DAOM 197198]|nr:hypothetical protein RIR_jg12117.t1 [Rhizophagus irregularis DAOM 181602=DAOM 197198]
MDLCEECNQNNTGYEWCRACNAKHFQRNFKNWTSDVTWEFINEIISHYKIGDNYNCYNCVTQLYGISQDPETQNYIMVLEYAEHGSLRNYLDKCYDKLSWKDKLNNLWWISFGLAIVHVKELIHRDLHNDANPLNRPIVNEIANILSLWYTDFDSYIELKQQIKESEEINNKTLGNSFISPTSSSLSYETHSEAIYTSRLLNFNNLPEPRNSGDYYNRYDDIISKEYSASLQIDISKLKINDDQEK